MRLLKILVFLVLILRINLFVFPSFKIDMNGWKAWSYKLTQSGPSNFYSKDYFSDYFPGYLYILWAAGSLFSILSLPINGVLFEFFLKFTTSLFDIGSAFFIYKIVYKYNKKWAHFAPVLYLGNPAIIFNSSVWGQTDGIFTFFLLASAYFLFEKKKIYKSSAVLTLGFLTKPHSVAFTPIFLVQVVNHFSKERILKSLGIVVLILMILSLPFFPKNPILGLIDLGTRAQNVYPYTSLFAFNLWGIFGPWQKDTLIFLVSLKTWGIIFYITSLVLISLPLLKKKIGAKHFYFAAALSFFSFFALLTRMHERYLFPFLAFMLIVAFINKSRILFVSWILISALHFINLFFVYYYYEFVYSNSKFADNILYIFVNDNFKFFSVLMVLLFLFLSFNYYKYVKKD